MAAVVTYDTSADVYYVRLLEGTVARTVEHGEAHLIDLDADDNVIGIEVVLPQDADFVGLAREFGLEDRTDEIVAAVDAAVGELRTVGTAVQLKPVYTNVTGVVVGSQSHAEGPGADRVHNIDLINC
jgi:uncharacterized protein YuzE